MAQALSPTASAPHGSIRAATQAALRERAWAILTAFFFIAMAVPFLLRHDSEWDDVYIRAAQHLRAGETIYRADEGFVYPPFMAFLAVPFTFASPFNERLLWYVVNCLALFFLCRWSWRLAGGATLAGKDIAIGLIGLACGLRYAVDCLAHQQTDIVVGAFVLGGCYALSHSRDMLAATAFGIAAGAKCTPLLWIGYLAWRRQWRAALWLLCVAVAINLLPDLIHGPPSGGLWLTHWLQRYLLPMTRADFVPGIWYSEIIYNQSLAGALNRWLTTTWTWKASGFAVTPLAHPSAPSVVKIVLYSLEVSLTGAVLLAFRSHWTKPYTQGNSAPSRQALEFSAVILLMLLFSPMSSKPHFCTLLLPGFCLGRLIMQRWDYPLLALVIAALIASWGGTKGLWGGDAAAVALWYGNVMWSAVFLLAATWLALAKCKPAESSTTATRALGERPR